MGNDLIASNKYSTFSREELIERLEFLELEKKLHSDLVQERFAMLKAAINIGDSLIWEYDVKNDKIHVDYELNARGRKAPSRLKIESFQKREDFLNAIYPDDRQEVYYDHFIRLIQGEICSYSIQYRRLFEEQIIWVEANVQAYKYNPDGTPSHVVYYLSDITEQKIFQDKLYKLENKYRKIIKAIPDAILILDKEARVLDVFSGSADNLIREPEFIKGKTVKELFPADVALSLHKAIKKTIQIKKEQNLYSTLLIDSDVKYLYNRIIPYEENEVIVLGRDVSDFMRDKQRIDFLNDLMRSIMDNIPVMIAVKEVEKDFRYLYFNQAAERFMGIKWGAVLGKNDFELFSDQEQARRVREHDLETVKKGQSVQYAMDYVTIAGEAKKVNAIRIVLNNVTEGKSPLLISILWDITKERENELQLYRIRESDKLKSAFLANMSHEIRTPLNAIVGFSTLLADTDDERERIEFVSIINKNNELLLQLIDDILDISKIEANMLEYNYEDVDLKALCTELYRMHSLKMKPGIIMNFNPDQQTVLLHTDERRVKQVLSNFLTNAIKFTVNGVITIRYEVRETDILVSVQDTGIGIMQENQQTIFDRFVKLDNYRQGTGLGLAICKMLIEHLGGEIGVESEVGKGSTFWFTLPLVSEAL